MEILKDLATGIQGKVGSVAYIVVHDHRAAGGASAPQNLLSDTSNRLNESSAAGSGAGAKDAHFRVQYNPHELQIYSVSNVLKKLDVTGSERTNATNPVAGYMDLSVTFFFDKMNPVTSFLMEKNLMPTSYSGLKAIKTYASAVGQKAGLTSEQEDCGVQKEVEGFIAALRNSGTRRVTLHLADFTFGGILNSVAAEYIMFASDGSPVRAKVSLRLRQNAGSLNRTEWIENFEKAFNNDQSSLVRPEQRLSSVLNLKF